MHKKNGSFLGKIVLHNYDVQKLKKFKRSNVSIFKLFKKKPQDRKHRVNINK